MRNFHRRLEEKARYSVGSRSMGPRGYQRLSMMSYDGQHEILTCTVDEIEEDSHRLRGRRFDKVSVHEEVELTDRIHSFLHFYGARATHVHYGNLGSVRIEASPLISDDKMYFVREESVGANPHISEHLLDALRYGLVSKPEFHGLIQNLSV